MATYDKFDPKDRNVIRLADELAKRRTGIPQSTIDAFWYLVRAGDEQRLRTWMEARSEWAPTFVKLLGEDDDE